MQDRNVKSKPPRMVRKQILITPDQSRRLKARAGTLDLTESELIREGIELALKQNSATEDWRVKLRKFSEQPGLDDAFADRVEQNKAAQAALWRKRIARTRKALQSK